jgi:hypothetical protein
MCLCFSLIYDSVLQGIATQFGLTRILYATFLSFANSRPVQINYLKGNEKPKKVVDFDHIGP